MPKLKKVIVGDAVSAELAPSDFVPFIDVDETGNEILETVDAMGYRVSIQL